MSSVWRFVAGVVLFAMLCVPGVASAQDDGAAPGDGQANTQFANPTAEQRRLNDEAARAIGLEDYTKAISFLEEALYIGELNVTYLNLGRAYQYMGKCEKAREALEAVAGAPAVRKPSPKFIAAKAREFLEELDETCQQEEPADEPASKQDGAQDAQKKQASDRADELGKDAIQPPPAAGDGGRATLGWTATIGGAALIGGGLGLHFWAESLRSDVSTPIQTDPDTGRVIAPTQSEVYENQSKANTLDTVGLSMGVVGGAAAVTGIYLVVTAEPDEQPALTVGPSVDGRGIVVGGRF